MQTHPHGADGPLPHGPLQNRTEASRPITTPDIPRPVLATLRWLDGCDIDVPACALAWTTHAVHVLWEDPHNGLTREWIEPADVRRGQAALTRIESGQHDRS